MVSIIIKFYEKFLIVLHNKPGKPTHNHWVFPGGKVEEGESPLDTVQRELLEETGLNHENGEISFLRNIEGIEYYLFETSNVSSLKPCTREFLTWEWVGRNPILPHNRSFHLDLIFSNL